MSRSLGPFGEQMERGMVQVLRQCTHPQAEPVILTTGERVAYVCVSCLKPLPADYNKGG